MRACQEVAAELVLRGRKLSGPSVRPVYEDVAREWRESESPETSAPEEEIIEEPPHLSPPGGAGNSHLEQPGLGVAEGEGGEDSVPFEEVQIERKKEPPR